MPDETPIKADKAAEEIDLIAELQEATDYKPEMNRPESLSTGALDTDPEFIPEEAAPVPE